MQQMSQRLVDVEGRDESTDVVAQLDGVFREALGQCWRQVEEEKREVVLVVADGRLGESPEPEAVVGEEEKDGVVEITAGVHPLEELAGWGVGQPDTIDVAVGPVGTPDLDRRGRGGRGEGGGRERERES